MIQVRAPDGTVIRFPDGTAPAQINQVMGQYHAQTLANADARQVVGHGKGDAGPFMAFMNGRTFNFAPEAMGAGAAINTAVDNLGRTLTGQPNPYGAADMYHAAAQEARREASAYAAEHPVANTALNVVGAVANPVNRMAGEFAASAKGLPAAVGRGAAVGGGTGAVYGAGAGGPGNRISGAAQGGSEGAALGAAIPIAGAVAGVAGRTVAGAGRNIKRAVGAASPSEVATHRLAAALAKDQKAGVDPLTNLANWSGDSKPTVADVAGENTRALVREAGSQGPARQVLTDYRNQVAADLQDHAISLTNNLTPGEARTAPAYTEAVRAEQSAAADKAYPAFKADPVTVTPAIASALSGDVGSGAMSGAKKLADALRDADTLGEIGALRSDNLPPQVSAGTLDLVRRGLRDAAGSAYSAGENTLGSGLKGRAQDLATALSDASPGFDTARKTFEGYARQIDAVDHGGSVLTAPPSMYAPPLTGATDQAMSGARVGARQALVDAIGRPTEAATGVLNRIATATNPGQNLGQTFGEDAADHYRQALGSEVQRMSNANFMAPNTGSQTFSKGEDSSHGMMSLLHAPVAVLAKVIKGVPLNDAERAAIVNPSIGDLDPSLLNALLAARRGPSLAPAAAYALPPAAALAATNQ